MEKVGSFLFLIFGIGPFLVSSFWPSVWSLILTDSPFVFRLRRLFKSKTYPTIITLIDLSWGLGWAGLGTVGVGNRACEINIFQYMQLHRKNAVTESYVDVNWGSSSNLDLTAFLLAAPCTAHCTLHTAWLGQGTKSMHKKLAKYGTLFAGNSRGRAPLFRSFAGNVREGELLQFLQCHPQ